MWVMVLECKSAIHTLCDNDINYFYEGTVYRDYLQCFDYRKLGHSLRLNTAPIILSACRSLDSQIPSGVFWIWAISGVWKALSKNKYCFFFCTGILLICQVPVLLGNQKRQRNKDGDLNPKRSTRTYLFLMSVETDDREEKYQARWSIT